MNLSKGKKLLKKFGLNDGNEETSRNGDCCHTSNIVKKNQEELLPAAGILLSVFLIFVAVETLSIPVLCYHYYVLLALQYKIHYGLKFL